MLLYKKPIAIERESESLLDKHPFSIEKAGPDRYLPYHRLYYDCNKWLLVDDIRDNVDRTVLAQCSRDKIYRDIDSCKFRKNISGYGVNFSLTEDNIALMEAFERFLAEKLAQWRMSD